MSFLEQLAQAYLTRERQRLGIPAEQRAEAANARANTALALQGSPEEAAAMRALRQREIEQELELKPRQVEAQLAATAQHGRLTEAQIADAQRRASAPIEVSRGATLATKTPEGGYKGVYTAPGAPDHEQLYPVQTVDENGRPSVTFVPKKAGVSQLPSGTAFATDVRAERKVATQATQPLNTVETLANQTEAALNKLDSTNALLHPIDKGVAQATYSNLLSALAVPWGRLLGDTRISDQDRQSYARSVGEPSFFLKEIAPEVARERLANLRTVIEDIRAKYGPVLEGTSGMLGPAAPKQPTGGTGKYKVIGVE